MKLQRANEILESLAYAIFRKSLARYPFSSFPLITGDTYRLLCDVDLTNSNYEELLRLETNFSANIFLPVGQISDFLKWAQKSVGQHVDWQIVLHNGDHELTLGECKEALKYFGKVCSVNWLGDINLATPLPIGLENLRYFRNGIPKHFKNNNFLPYSGWHERDIEILLSVKEANNLEHRKGLDAMLDFSSKNYVAKEFFSPTDYRNHVKAARFVLSPPGNGPDCHRTWEAIYLGSVPIVLRKFWNFGQDIPVLVVDDYSNLQMDIEIFKKNFTYSHFDPLETLKFLYLNPIIERKNI